ncbi:branched-chain amino acid transport system permease protein [Paracoccus isoporae]|uniref:Branched-chain amino acid transport system permease protein n=1 Tax=Paracoccus isoporae TaxID=591205 RepID=A0A1G6ZP68_9RHOB|nr:branched-chain amino acid ABC transporter permease [Paracoccus isoporae]SDE03356.1 branched-chain amino acid transport system permease protein [Paracoccus isoporae]
MSRYLNHFLIALALAGGVAVPWLSGSSFTATLMSQIAIAAVFSVSFNLMWGTTGLLSFGHALYFGAGAFTVMHLTRMVNDGGLAVPIALLPAAGGLCGLVLGLVLGSVATRRGGIAFAMITMGLGELAFSLSQTLKGTFGGESGISADRTQGPEMFGLTFGPYLQAYYLILAWALLCLGMMYYLTKTPLGRIATAVRDNPERAGFLQFDPYVVRLMMYVAASVFAGIAGGLSSLLYEIVTVEALSLNISSNVVLMSVIGGTGHFFGPVMGASLVTWLQSTLSDHSEAWLFYYGIFFVAMIVFAPGGLAGIWVGAVRMLTGQNRLAALRAVAGRALRLAPLVMGAVLAIELAYRASVVSTRGTELHLFGAITLDAANLWSWSVPGLCLAAGIWLLAAGRRGARKPEDRA